MFFPCGTTFVVPLSSFKTQVAGQAVQHDSQSADNGTVTHSRSTTQVRSPQLYQAMQQCTRLCKRLCSTNARRSVGAVARASAMPFLTVEIKSTTPKKKGLTFSTSISVYGWFCEIEAAWWPVSTAQRAQMATGEPSIPCNIAPSRSNLEL